MTHGADALPDDPETLKAMLIAEHIRSERLVQILKDMQRHRFGRRAETLSADRLLLALEDVEQSEAETAAEAEAKSAARRAEGSRKRRANRGALPPHLPRIETVIDVESRACPCCRGELHRIGEDVSEKLEGVAADRATCRLQGRFQVDGYAGRRALAQKGDVSLGRSPDQRRAARHDERLET